MSDTPTNDSITTEAADDSVHYYLRKFQRHPKVLATRAAVRSVRRFVPNTWRQATNQMRKLPGAVIVGVAKAGTTQLFAYMLRHPRCFGGLEKEVNFFSQHYDRGLGWYRSRFPLQRTVASVGGVCVEASNSYLLSADTLQRMRDALPHAKVMVCLRDPVARAFSQYQHDKQRHRVPHSFEHIVRESIAHSPPIVAHDRPLAAMPPAVSRFIWEGYYASLLVQLYQFYPREQVLLIDAADIFDDTNAMCQRVFDFIGLERFDVQPDKIYNRGYYREKVEPITAEVLRDHYRDHDEWLVELTGRTFRWMTAQGAASARPAA